MMKWIGTIAVLFLACTACAQQKEVQKEEPPKKEPVYSVVKTEEEWKKQLTEMQYYVTRENGTERAFSGELYNHKGEGTYHCVCCDNDLFLSATKFKSGTGWPSFYAPSSEEQVNSIVDSSYGMRRTEVECSTCGAHLGHVFEDGPKPTGLRYCINSASLSFKAKKE